ncbi:MULTISPECIES: hypothetical protein [Enterococcus]|uniref:hypothetical protein n=1 Tax=Enterococcus TaxID=1350 RepID=UPI000A736BA3|nr:MULTISPECIES: hypothetical protein [Enterococcus]
MDDKLFLKVMLPIAVLAFFLFLLPDFALKIPIGLVSFVDGLALCYYLEREVKKE